jgi:hypothetical protein
MADTNTTDDNDKSSVREYSGKWWCQQLEEVEKELDDRWRAPADKIVNRYLDDRRDSDANDSQRKYNIFWANVQIVKSALYANPPKPAVTRAHGDATDDIARVAAMIIERILINDLQDDDSPTHRAFNNGVEDRLLPGLGQVWARYTVETEKYQIPAVQGLDPTTNETVEVSPAQEAERITHEAAPLDYVHWRDFLWSPARTWEEVWWVGRRVWMKKKNFIKTFGQDAYDEIKGNSDTKTERQGNAPKGFTKGRVEVFEIWCEDTNKVYWVSRHADDTLKELDDPLKLEGFFPCPEPLLATHATNSLIPRPDYTMAQDQYEELDILNDRIATLTKSLRVVGVYDKDQTELKQLLSGPEFAMVAVDNWAMLAEKGGLKGTVDWFPVEVIAEVLERLMMQRQTVIQQIYELTSIADIMRGASNPRETLGAQQLKSQYSSVRLQLTQQAVGRWIQGALRLKTEIICRHWQPETIATCSQIGYTESAKFAVQAIQLLKGDFDITEYRIDVTEESLSIADYNAERQLRSDYLVAVGQFLSQAAQMIQIYPTAIPYVLKMIAWVTAAFRGSADIETVLDEAITIATNMPPQPAGQPGAKGAEAPSEPKPAPEEVEAARARSTIAINNNDLRNDLARIQAEGMRDLILQDSKQQNDHNMRMATEAAQPAGEP